MPGLDWLIVGVIAVLGFIAWALGNDISRAHHTLIELHQTLRSLELDVAQIRDRVAPSAVDLESL